MNTTHAGEFQARPLHPSTRRCRGIQDDDIRTRIEHVRVETTKGFATVGKDFEGHCRLTLGGTIGTVRLGPGQPDAWASGGDAAGLSRRADD